MDDSMLDKIGQGMMMFGIGCLIHSVSKLPKETLQDIGKHLDDGKIDEVKKLVGSSEDARGKSRHDDHDDSYKKKKHDEDIHGYRYDDEPPIKRKYEDDHDRRSDRYEDDKNE